MRGKCVVCGAKLEGTPIYICENMPSVCQNLPTKKNLDEDRPVDLPLCQCSKCGLVQFDCEPVSYYKDSTRAGERSEVLVRLRQEQYKHLIETYHLKGKKILEVGAGKGGFLKTLKEMDEYQIEEYGIENNQEFVNIAREKEQVNVFCGDAENPGLNLPDAPYDAFVSFAYPARLIHPNEMLTMVSNNLTEEGVGLVMVPSLEHLLKPGGFFDIVRDHIAYYSIDTLKFLFQKNGFEVLETGEVAKLYIYAYVKKRARLDITGAWSDTEPLLSQIRDFVAKEKDEGRKVAVWCAGHFAFTVLSVGRMGDDIEYIIDNADFKKGHYAPGSHILIIGPEFFVSNPVDTIIILGPIYIDEIVEEIKKKCSPDVKIATMDKKGLRVIHD